MKENVGLCLTVLSVKRISSSVEIFRLPCNFYFWQFSFLKILSLWGENSCRICEFKKSPILKIFFFLIEVSKTDASFDFFSSKLKKLQNVEREKILRNWCDQEES